LNRLQIKPEKHYNIVKISILSIVSALVGIVFSGHAAVYTVFNDTFNNGSTTNGVSTPGGTPSASSTSYDIASSKNATASAISSGIFTLTLNTNTGSGFLEAQAVFSSTPITLATVGQYINFTYTFTDTSNLFVGGASSAVFNGLYDDAGVPPLPGYLANSGLSTTTASTNATGGCANWSGYVSEMQSNKCSMFTRPVQNGAGTTSANQELIGNNFGGGAFNNPTGTNGVNASSTAETNLNFTAGNQYTVSYTITLSAATTFTISQNVYSGANTSGMLIGSLTNTFTAADFNFDGLAIGIRNSGNSVDPVMSISQITVTDNVGAPAVKPLLGKPSWSPTGGAVFTISGTSGNSYRVWATANVALTPVTNTWTQVTSGTFGASATTYTDAAATSFPKRFYIITSP